MQYFVVSIFICLRLIFRFLFIELQCEHMKYHKTKLLLVHLGKQKTSLVENPKHLLSFSSAIDEEIGSTFLAFLYTVCLPYVYSFNEAESKMLFIDRKWRLAKCQAIGSECKIMWWNSEFEMSNNCIQRDWADVRTCYLSDKWYWLKKKVIITVNTLI